MSIFGAVGKGLVKGLLGKGTKKAAAAAAKGGLSSSAKAYRMARRTSRYVRQHPFKSAGKIGWAGLNAAFLYPLLEQTGLVGGGEEDLQGARQSDFMRSLASAEAVDTESAISNERGLGSLMNYGESVNAGLGASMSSRQARDAVSSAHMLNQYKQLQGISVPMAPPSMDEILAIMQSDD